MGYRLCLKSPGCWASQVYWARAIVGIRVYPSKGSGSVRWVFPSLIEQGQDSHTPPGRGVAADRRPKAVVRYALAIAAAIVALYLRELLAPFLGTQNPYHTVWAAV